MRKITLRRIFHYYWIHAKKYPKTGVVTFVFYSIGAILATTLLPLIYKQVVDVMSGSVEISRDVSQELFGLFLYVVGLIVVYNIVFRLADYAMTYFQSNVLKELADDVFIRIHRHSYAFFADNFAGSLVTKAKRYVRSFETMHDHITFSFVFQGVHIVGAFVVMFYVVPLIGTLYLLWLVLYGFLVALFIQKKMPYDLQEAEADSKVTARYADTITNVLAIKMFASNTREEKSFFVFV